MRHSDRHAETGGPQSGTPGEQTPDQVPGKAVKPRSIHDATSQDDGRGGSAL
jgi:hypothetical protein